MFDLPNKVAIGAVASSNNFALAMAISLVIEVGAKIFAMIYHRNKHVALKTATTATSASASVILAFSERVVPLAKEDEEDEDDEGDEDDATARTRTRTTRRVGRKRMESKGQGRRRRQRKRPLRRPRRRGTEMRKWIACPSSLPAAWHGWTRALSRPLAAMQSRDQSACPVS